MTKYYADGFRSGKLEPITKNQIFLSARPHSKDATPGDSIGKPTRGEFVSHTTGQIAFLYHLTGLSSQSEDFLYAVVFASGPGTLKLSIGTSSSSSPIVAGVNKIKLKLSPGASAKATLMDSAGKILVDFAPKDFTFDPSPKAFNFNYRMAASP